MNTKLLIALLLIPLFISCIPSAQPGEALMNKVDKKSLTYRDIIDESVVVKTTSPTELKTITLVEREGFEGRRIYESEEVRVKLPTGTLLRVLAQVDDGYYFSSYQPNTPFLVLTPDDTRGIVQLPEACVGKNVYPFKGNKSALLRIAGINKKIKNTGSSQAEYDCTFPVKLFGSGAVVDTLASYSLYLEKPFPIVNCKKALYYWDKEKLQKKIVGMSLAGVDNLLMPAQYITQKGKTLMAVYSHVGLFDGDKPRSGSTGVIFENNVVTEVVRVSMEDQWGRSFPGMETWGTFSSLTPSGSFIYFHHPCFEGFHFRMFGSFFYPFFGILITLVFLALAVAFPWMLCVYVLMKIKALSSGIVFGLTLVIQFVLMLLVLYWLLWGSFWLWIAGYFFVIIVLVYPWINHLMLLTLSSSRCPSCRECNCTEQLGSEDAGSYIAKGNVQEADVYSHSTVKQEGRTETTTNYYKKERTQRVTQVVSGRDYFRCKKCGHLFTVSFKFTNSHTDKV